MAKKEKIIIDYDRLPPQAIDIEQAVLGAILIEPNSDLTVIDFLKPESFYDPRHQKIFKAIMDLSSEFKPIDRLTVVEQLKENGELEEIGGPLYIIELTQKVASAAHLEFHAKIVAQKFIQRELLTLSTKLQSLAYDETKQVEDILEEAQKELLELVTQNIKQDARPIEELLKERIQHIQDLYNRKDKIELTGIPTGFKELDRMTSGLQNSDLILIAARPSMGKTAFLLSIARNIAVEAERKVAIFSLEMSAEQLVQRLIVSETEINSNKLKTGRLTEDELLQLHERIKPLENAKIYIDDTPGLSLFELRAKCRKIKAKYGLDIVFVDYLQLMTGPVELRNNREQEVSHISRGLKNLAKELNVPVVALSQLNRAVEHHKTNRPQLSNLRESGSLEQDADIVIFIHRPYKLGITETPDGESTKELAEIIIAKFRNGPTGDINLRFIDDYAKFVEFETEEEMSIPDDLVRLSSKINDETDNPDNINDDFDLPENDDFDFSDSEDQTTPF